MVQIKSESNLGQTFLLIEYKMKGYKKAKKKIKLFSFHICRFFAKTLEMLKHWAILGVNIKNLQNKDMSACR